MKIQQKKINIRDKKQENNIKLNTMIIGHNKIISNNNDPYDRQVFIFKKFLY